MRRGFFFTVSVISFAVLMLAAISLQHQLNSSPVPFLLLSKVTYSWEDVSEGLAGASGINVTKSGSVLSVIDELPASVSIPTFINRYVSFVRRFYNSSDLSVSFYSATGQEITDFSCFGKGDCSDNQVQFHVLPFNITYSYTNWDKRQLDVVCYASSEDGFPACDFSRTRAVNISINLTRMNFTCNPAVYNNCAQSQIGWDNDFEDVFGCSGSEANCINYSLIIRDNNSRTYACQGVYGDNSGSTRRVNCNAATLNWRADEESVLSIDSPPCHIDLRFGNEGRFRIEGSAPAGGSCGVNMSTNVVFTFNTSDFWTDFSTEMLVRDELANYSIRTPVR